MNLWVSIGLVQRVDGLKKNPVASGPTKKPHDVDLPRTVSFLLKALRRRSFLGLETAGISMIIQAIGKGSKVMGYHIVSPDCFKDFVDGSNLAVFF